jgi:hypothetical protein
LGERNTEAEQAAKDLRLKHNLDEVLVAICAFVTPLCIMSEDSLTNPAAPTTGPRMMECDKDKSIRIFTYNFGLRASAAQGPQGPLRRTLKMEARERVRCSSLVDWPVRAWGLCAPADLGTDPGLWRPNCRVLKLRKVAALDPSQLYKPDGLGLHEDQRQ